MPRKKNQYSNIGIYPSEEITKKLVNVQEALKYYREILYQIEILSMKLGITNNLDIAHLYEYLLTHGYLSINHQFSYQKNVPLRTINGMQLMSGNGNCYNQASMLHNLLEESNREAYMIAVRTLNSQFLSSHVQVLIAENRNYYVFDPTMHLYGRPDFHLNSFTKDGKTFKFGYISTMFRISNFINNHQSAKNYLNDSKLKLVREKNKYVSGQLIDVFANPIYNCFEQNKDLIDSFYGRVYPSICKVDSHNKLPL